MRAFFRDLPDKGHVPRALKVTLAVVAVALFLPHLWSPTWPTPGERTLPRVFSGDEPHYLVLINSVVRDGDLDVSNNYLDVHQGGFSAGLNFRGWRIDHHSAWIAQGEYRVWNSVYEGDGRKWPVVGPNGISYPPLLEGVSPRLAPTAEYSMHWPGLAFLLAPVLFPFAGSELLESVALLCAWAAIVLAMLAFASIARTFGTSTPVTCAAIVLVFLGTPIWNYARALFAEPFALSVVLWAYALFFANKRLWLTGLLCAVALMLKATFVTLVAPLGIALLVQRRWKDTAVFGAFCLGAAGLTVLLNHAMFGRWLQGPQPWLPGDFKTGAVGLLTASDHGLLLFAPVLISAAIGWPALLKAHRREALTALGAIAGLYCLIAPFGLWPGGYCYGPRYLLPALPLMMLGLLMRSPSPRKGIDVVVLGLASFVINVRGTFPSWESWARHPLEDWFPWLAKLHSW